ncbi:MAG: DUF4276 family protein [Terriglobia bacterium]
MSRIVVLCEGDTEELAVRHFIVPQWNSEGLRSVGLKCINLNGKIEKLGKFASGHLDDQEVLAVFTLVDLQGMTKVSHQLQDSLETKIQRVRNWLNAQVHRARANRFYPHLCVHQTEAWILAEGCALAVRLGDTGVRPDLRAELKNFQNPPSERLNELFLRIKRRRYNKIADGTPLFKLMQFAPVYNSCRYFQELYNDLRAAAARQ